MKTITITKYQSNDGQSWDKEIDAINRDKYLDWNNNIPEDILQIQKLLINIFKYKKTDVEDWFVIDRIEMIKSSTSLEFCIKMPFHCSNDEISAAIGNLIDILSKIKVRHTFLSFRNGQPILNINPSNTKETIDYLTSL